MKKRVIDATTLLTYLQGEPGADAAGEYCKSAIMSVVNLTEVFQRAMERGSLSIVQAIVQQANIGIVPMDSAQAAAIAELNQQTKDKGLSLTALACITLGISRNLPIVTGDRSWADLGLSAEFVLLRNSSKS